MNWRKLPHPKYGNFGGVYQTADKQVKAIDWMDGAFKKHDYKLKAADNKDYNIKLADCELLLRLKKGSQTKLARPIYGTFYRYAAIFIFTIACRA